MNTPLKPPTVILIAGHWLGAWAWDDVRAYLTTDGVRSVALTLPGLDVRDPDRASRTVEDQASAILDVLSHDEHQPAILVAHSGANAPVSLVIDRHPERVHHVVWVDSGPVSTGSAFAPDLPEDVVELPLPPFDVLGQQASLDELTPERLEQFRARAVPEPGPVLRQPVDLTNEARRRINTTLVCCSISGAHVLELARNAHPMFSEVAKLEHLDVIDLPTGHWPMWSRPRDLAQIIEEVASGSHRLPSEGSAASDPEETVGRAGLEPATDGL